MLLLYNNFITFRESVNYAIEYKQELKGEIELIQNDLNKKDKLILKSSSYLGAFYNLKDSFKNYDVEIIENIDQDKEFHPLALLKIENEWELLIYTKFHLLVRVNNITEKNIIYRYFKS